MILTDKKPYLQFAEMICNTDSISKVSPHPPLKNKTDIPNNLTLLTEYIKNSRNMMAFQRRNAFNMGGGVGKKKKAEEERDLIVWFCFAASFDLDMAYII